MKTSWKDITIADLMKIREIDELQIATDDEKNLMVAAIVAEKEYDEILEMPLEDVREYMEAAGFLLNEPGKEKARRYYFLNGRRYDLFKDPSEMTVAQYIDFQSIYQDGFDKRPAEMLSIFLIPHKHEYNDGYDKDQVIEDMYQMSVEEALGIVDFFTGRFVRSISRALTFLKARMKVMRLMARKKDKEMYKALETQMNLVVDELECIYGSLASRPSLTLPNTTGKRHSK